MYHDAYEQQQAAFYQQGAGGYPYPEGYEQTGFRVPTPAWGEYDGFREDYLQDESFQKNLQFGIIDNGLLVAMTLAGVSLEDQIADRVGDADGSRGAGVEDGAEPHVARIRRRWRGPSGVRRLVQSPR